MKKLVALIAVLCLVFSLVVYFKLGPSATDIPEEPSASGIGLSSGLDYDAIYALHAPDEVVATIGGRDVTWQEYYRHFCMNAQQLESSFQSILINYGTEVSWTDTFSSESDETFADYLTQLTESSLRQEAVLDSFSERNSLNVETDAPAILDESLKGFIKETFGEDAGEKELSDTLAGMGTSLDSFKLMGLLNQKSTECFNRYYGENAEKVSDEDALAILERDEYLYATHILLMTMNPNTGETLSEDEALDKKALADELYAKLSAIEDPEELIAEFSRLKQENCEDTGKLAYPDGYTFKPGTMVSVFEDTCKSLESYGVSEPVESSYGYHIIMRLPLSATAPINIDSDGSITNAKTLFANEDFGLQLQSIHDELGFTLAPGFETVNVLDFVK